MDKTVCILCGAEIDIPDKGACLCADCKGKVTEAFAICTDIEYTGCNKCPLFDFCRVESWDADAIGQLFVDTVAVKE